MDQLMHQQIMFDEILREFTASGDDDFDKGL